MYENSIQSFEIMQIFDRTKKLYSSTTENNTCCPELILGLKNYTEIVLQQTHLAWNKEHKLTWANFFSSYKLYTCRPPVKNTGHIQWLKAGDDIHRTVSSPFQVCSDHHVTSDLRALTNFSYFPFRSHLANLHVSLSLSRGERVNRRGPVDPAQPGLLPHPPTRGPHTRPLGSLVAWPPLLLSHHRPLALGQVQRVWRLSDQRSGGGVHSHTLSCLAGDWWCSRGSCYANWCKPLSRY